MISASCAYASSLFVVPSAAFSNTWIFAFRALDSLSFSDCSLLFSIFRSLIWSSRVFVLALKSSSNLFDLTLAYTSWSSRPLILAFVCSSSAWAFIFVRSPKRLVLVFASSSRIFTLAVICSKICFNLVFLFRRSPLLREFSLWQSSVLKYVLIWCFCSVDLWYRCPCPVQ